MISREILSLFSFYDDHKKIFTMSQGIIAAFTLCELKVYDLHNVASALNNIQKTQDS